MKKIILFAIALNYLSGATAQNVGIGTTTPGFPLNFSNALGDKISLYGASGNHYGFGIQGGLLQIHSDAAAANIAFGYGTSTAFTERMRIINSGTEGMLLKGRLSLQNGTSPLIENQTPGIWLYKANNSGVLSFVGTYDNQTVGFYGGPAGWGLTYDAINSRVGIGNLSPNAPLAFPPSLGKKITLYPGATGDVGFGVAGNRLQIYSDNPNADVAIGYDAAGVFNERFSVKPTGALAVNGNTGVAGQILQSNGTAAASWTGKPYVIYYNQSDYVWLTGTGVLALPIPGLDNQTFTLTQNSRIVFTTTLYCQGEELINATRFFSEVQILNSSGTIVERATCHVLIPGGFEKANANSTGIGILPAGTYTVRAFLRRKHDTDGFAACYAGSVSPAAHDFRGGQMIIQVFPE